MKVYLLNCFLMLAFLSLIGCSQNQKSVNLQVSASFEIGTAGFTGGLIAYGEGPNGAKFAVSSGTGKSINTTISDGTWKIYVMGWENLNNANKFEGYKQCGMSEVNLASNDTNVNITLSANNCAGTTFAADTVPKDVLISSCGGFYNYDAGADTYSSPASDGFCSSLPTALQTSFEYYRLALPTIQGATVSTGIITECIVAKGAAGPRLGIPTKKFPFRVMMFRSLQDCMDPTNPRMSAFGFLNGLENGNQPSFDQYYYSSGGNALLVLPTSMTRRGYSPFMDMIPRIPCGTDDCFAQPDLPTFNVSGTPVTTQFNVPWFSDMFMSGNNDNKTIIKGFRPTNYSSNTCDSPTLSLLNQNPNFSVEKCSIQNGDLRGNFARNELICRGSTDFGYVQDLYERNGRIYHYVNDVQKIRVYSEKGVQVSEVSLAAGQTYKSMATDSENNLYVVVWEESSAPDYRKLVKYNFSNGYYTYDTDWNSTVYPYLEKIEKIEVTDTGKIVAATNNSIQAFDFINAAGNVVNMNGSSPIIKKILFRNSKLYILTFESSYSELYAATLSGMTGLTLSSLGTSYFNGASSEPEYASFHYTEVAGNKYFVFNPKGQYSDLQIYPDPYALTTPSLTTPYHTIAYNAADIASGGPIIMVKNMIYKKSATGFTARKFIPGTTPTANVVGSTGGSCTAQLTQGVTTNSPAYALNLRSASDPTFDIIFDEAFRFIGRTFATENSFYYFRNLADSNKDDGPNAGGVLGRVEQMLGPDGLGGVLNGLYPGQGCVALRDNVVPAVGSVTKTATIYDIIEGSTQTVSINFSKPEDGVGMMGTFACGGAGSTLDCAADLVVDISMVGKSDKMRLKLDCDAKRGSMETMGYKVSDTENHHLILWNTDSSNAQYEEYRLEDRIESSEVRTNASVTRLVKEPSTYGHKIEMRHLEINRNNTAEKIEGWANEFYRSDSSGDKFMSTAVKTGFIDQYDWDNSTVAYSGIDRIDSVIGTTEIRSITTYPTANVHYNAGICMASGNSSLAIVTALTCSVPTAHIIVPPSMETDVTTLQDLDDYTTHANGAMKSEFATDVFELTQP